MDGTDNKNVSEEEVFEFIKKVFDGNVACPICKKNFLEVDDVYVNKPTFETYICGLDYFWTIDISCPCGFENRFSSFECRKGISGTVKRKYRVGLAIGGVMEKPDFTYEKIEEIEAYSEQDAIDRYKEEHPGIGSGYWHISVVPDYY